MYQSCDLAHAVASHTDLPNMYNHALEFSVSMLSLKYISDMYKYIDTTVD